MIQPLTSATKTHEWTAADIVDRFGPIPIGRIRRTPPPGEATAIDVEEIYLREKRLCELVDGVLVDKTAGTYESFLAIEIATFLRNFVRPKKLGAIFGADGMMRLAPDLIRIPDVSFVAAENLPDGKVPHTAFLEQGPDLAVEIISVSNTKCEMDRKWADYFNAGVRLVWYVYPETREVHVFTSASEFTKLEEQQTLTGGEVLSGFELRLADLFDEPAKQP